MGVCVSVYQSRVYPCDKSWPIQARIAWFGPKAQNTFGRQSTLTFKVKINFDLVCPDYNAPSVEAGIQFGPEMQNNLVEIPIVGRGGGIGILDRFTISIDS